jgi:hypothetical protein
MLACALRGEPSQQTEAAAAPGTRRLSGLAATTTAAATPAAQLQVTAQLHPGNSLTMQQPEQQYGPLQDYLSKGLQQHQLPARWVVPPAGLLAATAWGFQSVHNNKAQLSYPFQLLNCNRPFMLYC